MRYRILALLAVMAVAAAIATPAESDEAPVLTVSGVVVTLADAENGDTAVIVAGSDAVPVEPDAVAGFATGTRVEAELAIPAAVARGLNVTRDVAAGTALGAAVIDSADAPLEVAALEEVAVAGATTATAAAAGVHYLDIAVNTKVDDGSPQPSDAVIRAAVKEASDYFVANTGGVFPGFAVRNVVRYRSALPCGSSKSDFAWAADAAKRFGHSLDYYFQRPAEHVVLIGECRHDAKAAIGSLGEDLGSGGFIAVQADFFGHGDAREFLSGTIAHEFGHNFGLTHANAPDLSPCAFTSVPIGTDITTCKTLEYGDDWSVMGFAVPISWVPLLDIARREQLGLTTPATLATQSGVAHTTYELASLGAATGLKGVKVTVASGTYYVEYRDGTGEPTATYLRDGDCTGEWEPSATCSARGDLNPEGPGVRIIRLLGDDETRVAAVRTRIEVPTFAELGLDSGDWWRSAAGDATVAIGAMSDGAVTVTVSTGTSAPAVNLAAHLTGAPTVGEDVTVVVDAISPGSADVSFQWLRNGAAIPGATGTTYAPTVADAGTTLAVLIKGSAPGYLAKQILPSAAVTPGLPVIDGAKRVGDVLTAAAGTWPDGFTLTYRWYRNGSALAGATNPTYRATASDLGKKITVRVTGTHPTLGTATLTSAAAVVELGRLTAPVPVISGTATVGRTLTLVRGTWTAGTSFSYRWYANGAPIGGAVTSTYKVPSAMAGKKITVKVTGTKTAYASRAVTSAAVGVPKVGKATITGTAKARHTLAAHHGEWTSGTTFTYQWYAGGVAIPGATKSTYWVQSAYVGSTIVVKIRGTRSGYTTVTTRSPSTSTVVW